MRVCSVLLTLLAASNAAAANLLTNSDFDEDLTGWSHVLVTATWDAFDRDDPDPSGSAKIVSSVPHGGLGPLDSVCVVVSGDTDYTVTGWSYIPADAVNTEFVIYIIPVYAGFDCTDGLFFPQAIAGGNVGEWILTEKTFTTPVGANSARVRVGPFPFEDGVGDAVGFVDSITLPEPASTVLQASALALLAALAARKRWLGATPARALTGPGKGASTA